ncbi:MAG TPA: J domain-containing protein [Chthoniobacter sp.]|nr:J domain-containing protein [Chthoniobacter sp.]
MPAPQKMSWLDFAFGVASRTAKKLQAEYQAGKEGRPSPAQPPRRRAMAAPTSRPAGPPWWEVLRVPRGSSLREVSAAYRDGISKNHPDKVAHLSDKLRQVAEYETRRLNAAYEEAKRALDRKA